MVLRVGKAPTMTYILNPAAAMGLTFGKRPARRTPGRVFLEKYVDTSEVTITVDLSHGTDGPYAPATVKVLKAEGNYVVCRALASGRLLHCQGSDLHLRTADGVELWALNVRNGVVMFVDGECPDRAYVVASGEGRGYMTTDPAATALRMGPSRADTYESASLTY